jgi:hypothetical protein
VSTQPFRQVHLDFHTSAQCADVGVDFDADQFVSTLKMGHVASINVFAKCHHGYSYYPTQVGTMHPNLSLDLLGAQVDALHRAGIRCPIYVTIKWDDLAGIQHPEWICVKKDGTLNMRPPTSGNWGWTTLDVASGYGDYVLAQTAEILDCYDVDGFWFDICFTAPNYSPWAQDQMRRAGVRLDDDAAVWRYAEAQDDIFYGRLSDLVRSKRPTATIFYNGTINPAMRKIVPHVTHLEVESLPTSGGVWGYLHFPIMGRQARTYGLEMVAMNGRFHKSWADFGGLKTRDQLDYECGTIVAAGAKISCGDQLHPRGVLDPAVYRLLGHSFGLIERLEPWLEGAQPAAEVAILALGQSGAADNGVGAPSPDVEGAAQLLLETGIQFDIVDAQADFSSYAALILPDAASLESSLQARLQTYLDNGGRLVLSGTAALDPANGEFQLAGVPARFIGPAPTIPSYLHPGLELATEGELAADYDYVFYDQAYLVEPREAAVTHGEVRRALFTRTWEHFTSHQHAPVGESLTAPLVVQNEQVLYFAAPLFTGYRNHDYWAYRAMAQNALRAFLPQPLLKPLGPGWVEFTLHRQPAADGHPARRVVHVVAYHPRRTLQSVPHVDQSWPTADLGVSVRLDGVMPERVYLAPDRTPLAFKVEGEYARIALPPVGVHSGIVLE